MDCPPFREACALTRIPEDIPGVPVDDCTKVPLNLPANTLERLDVGISKSSWAFTDEIAEVNLDFFCVPYPTTTTSSKSAKAVSSSMVNSWPLPVIGMVLELYPTIETI